MALSDEQRAMLRLLAQREQGYDDIAALMGLSVEEVRAKVAGALSQIEDEGKPAPDVPPPEPKGPEIGGPDPAGEADSGAAPKPVAGAIPSPPVPKQPAAAPKPPAPPKVDPNAGRPVTAKAAADQAESRATPPPAGPASGGSSTGGGHSGGGSSGSGARTITLPSGRGLWPWIGGAVAIIVVVVVVVLIAGGGGGDSSSTEAANTAPETAEGTLAKEASGAAEPGETGETGEEAPKVSLPKGVTQAVLKPVAGGAGAGKAIFGRVKNKLALQVVASGLETTGKDDAYTIWLAQSEQKMLPLASSAVLAKDKGKIAAQYEVPTEVLSYLANGTFDQIFITHTQNAQLAASLKEATTKKQAPAYTGEAALSGTVTGPIVGAALREEEEEEAEEKGE